MDQKTAINLFDTFLLKKELEIRVALSSTSPFPERISGGWVFQYQSKSFVDSGNFSSMLAGHGPVIVTDEARIIEGGSGYRSRSLACK
jgi:hypothetical protein